MDWMHLLENFGFPLTSLVVICLAVTYVAKFVARELIVPVRDKLIARFMTTFDKIDAFLDRIDNRGIRHDDSFTRIEDILWRIEGRLEETQETCQATLGAVRDGTEPASLRPPRPARPLKPPRPPRSQPQPPSAGIS